MNEIEIRVTSSDHSGPGFDSARRRALALRGDLVTALGTAGTDGGKAFTRNVEGQLRDSRGRFTKAMGDSGGESASRFGMAFAPVLLKQLKDIPMGPALAVAGGVAAPMLASTIATGVTLGLSGGAVAFGLAGAFQDPKVKAEATDFAAEMKAVLVESTASFVPVTLVGMRKLRSEIRSMQPEITGIVTTASRFVDPLINMGTGFLRNVLPGIRSAVESAEPLFDVLEKHGPRLGASAGEFFDRMGSAAEDAAGSFEALLLMAEGSLEYSGFMIDKLATLEKWAGGGAMHLAVAVTGGGEVENASNNLNDLKEAADSAAERIKKLNDAFDELFDTQMGLDRAVIDFKKGQRELNEELTHGRRTLKANTKEGLENREAVLNQLESIKRLRDARVREGMSVDEANAKYSAHVTRLRRTMLQAGFTKAEVDALIGSYRRVPKEANTKVGVTGTGPAYAEMVRLRRAVNSIPRFVRIHASVDSSGNISTGSGRILRGSERRWGGVTERAQFGLLREAGMYAPTNPGRFMIAEPETGGEAFVPKFGNHARSLGILTKAASWYGAQVVPAGGGTGGGQSGGTVIHIENLHLPGVQDPPGLVRALQQYCRHNGPIRGVTVG